VLNVDLALRGSRLPPNKNFFFYQQGNVRFAMGRRLVLRNLALGFIFSVFSTGRSSVVLAAGIPVLDLTNLSQNIMTAMESVAQTLKQIEQYKTQLQQYENMLQNSAAPAAYIWDQANSTITKLMSSIDTLSYYKQQAGNIDSYLARYQNTAFYSNSPCFTNAGCTPEQLQHIRNAQSSGSEAQKRANDAVLRGIDQQQTTLESDARQLALLQQQAQGATGQMAAIQYANQLASAQTNQLMQIRGLLLAQQNADTTHAAVVADREAQQEAAAQQLRSGSFKKSPSQGW